MKPKDIDSLKDIHSLKEIDSSTMLCNYLAAGDLDAYEFMYGVAFEIIIKYYVWNFYMSQPDAEDLAQELFIHVSNLLAKKSYQNLPNKRFTGWLYTIAHNFGVDYFEKLNKQPRVYRFNELGREREQGHGPDRETDFLERYSSHDYSTHFAGDFLDVDGKSEQGKEEEEEEKERQRAEANRLKAIKTRRMKIALLSTNINYQALLLLMYRDGWGYKRIHQYKLVFTSRGKAASLSALRVIKKQALRAVDKAYANILAQEEANEGR